MAFFRRCAWRQVVALAFCVLVLVPASLSEEAESSDLSVADAVSSLSEEAENSELLAADGVSSERWFLNDTLKAFVEPIHPSAFLVSVENGEVQAWGKVSVVALWSFSSGPPLVSFSWHSGGEGVSGESDEEGEWLFESPEVSMGEDGSVSVHDSLNRTKTLNVKLDDLRQGSVHVRKGEIIKVDRRSTIFLVDSDTGIIVRELGTHDGQDLNYELEKKSLFVIRTDYVAKATNLSGSALWTLSYGEIGTFVSRLQPSSGDDAALSLLPRMSSTGVPSISQGVAVSQASPAPQYLKPPQNPAPRALPAALAPPSLPLPNPGLAIWEEHQVYNNGPYKHAPGMLGSPAPEPVALSMFMLFTTLAGMVTIAAFFNRGRLSSLLEKATSGWLVNKLSLPTKAERSTTTPPKKRKGRKSSPSQQDIQGLTPEEAVVIRGGGRLGSSSKYGHGQQVGRLFVTETLIGSGSHGTLVLEGYLDDRPVAVKRLLAQYYEKAQKEIGLLIASDEHPNVVRYYATEKTRDFVYVSLERCSFSLYELIFAQTSQDQGTERQVKECLAGKGLKLRSTEDFLLWDDECRPSAQLFQIMRDIVAGLAHLHAVGIVHRDLKPHNVLISSGRIMQAKIADMGLSKQLDEDAVSFDTQLTGHWSSGSRGWQAPEQLLRGRGSRAVDIFSLGCVLYYCITGGKHPYGSHLERDGNIAYGKMDLFHIVDLPEATDLLERLLDSDPTRRPPAQDILQHPFFWDPEKSLSFLKDASDRVELDIKDENSALLGDLESLEATVLCGGWDAKLDPTLLHNIRGYRRYSFKSVRDLLRVIRNKANHFGELPENLKDSLGPVPDGLDYYFRSRFPRMLIEIYQVIRYHCRGELAFEKYYAASYCPKFPLLEPCD